MAAKRSDPGPVAVTAERAQRLYRLLKLLGEGPKTRATLIRKLRLAERGFYRDLEILRDVGIQTKLEKGKYLLADDLDDAIERLPFPDPGINLGEARRLSRGRHAVHRKIKSLIDSIEK